MMRAPLPPRRPRPPFLRPSGDPDAADVLPPERAPALPAQDAPADPSPAVPVEISPQPVTAARSTAAERTYVVHAVKDCATYFPADVTYAAVQQALDGVAAFGAWAGPPRLTRMANSCKLHVARVWRFNDDMPVVLSTHTATLRDRTRERLEALTQVNAWAVTADMHNESTNGPLAWWTSGEAARTQTRDQYPEAAARLDPEENPVGPTSGATHPRSPLDVTGTIADSVGVVVALAALGAGALWWFGRGGGDRGHELRIRVDRGGRRKGGA